MKINALLDVDLVAVETADEVSALLEISAPDAPADASRTPASLQIVLDRSGSMHGEPFESAKAALVELVKRLDPADQFGLVVFDDTAEVVVPIAPLSNKAAVTDRITRMCTGGSTDLSAGYLRGLRELRRVGATSGTVLVISDGHVNAGVRNLDDFADIAAKAYADGIITSTLGYGLGYDETLLEVISRGGVGNHVFAADPDEAAAAIAGEVDGLLSTVAQAVSLSIHREPSVTFARLHNDLPVQIVDDQTAMIELGNLYAGETRKLLCTFGVPALADLGTATVATISLSFVELPELVERTVSIPLNVNVVPGDEAAGRVPRPEVHTELLVQRAQGHKREASTAFAEGRLDDAQRLLAETRSGLEQALTSATGDDAIGIRSDLEDVEGMSEAAVDDCFDNATGTMLAKSTLFSFHTMNRQRGRARRREHLSSSDPTDSMSTR